MITALMRAGNSAEEVEVEVAAVVVALDPPLVLEVLLHPEVVQQVKVTHSICLALTSTRLAPDTLAVTTVGVRTRTRNVSLKTRSVEMHRENKETTIERSSQL